MLRKVMRLKLNLESRATGKEYDKDEYQQLANEITSDKSLINYLPDFLILCNTLDEFWIYIKNEYKSYNERRLFLIESFSPLMNYLEQNLISEQKDIEGNQDMPFNLFLRLKRLKIILESRATGKEEYNEEEYQQIREEIISLQNLQNYIPHFLFVCYNLDDFWSFIKNEYNSYDERRKFLNDSLTPLFTYVFGKQLPITQKLTTVQEPTTTHEPSTQKEKQLFKYDIAFSFAGEDRILVESIAQKLKDKQISLFYDKNDKVALWGEKLTTHFAKIYGHESRFVMPFISKHYSVKEWTDFEFTILHAEAKKRKGHFILPIRIDDTPILGSERDLGYLDMAKESVDSVVEAIIEKLNSDI